MDKLVLSSTTAGAEAAEEIHQSSCNSLIDPNIAVYNPHNIAFGLSVGPAHISDLRVRTEIMWVAIVAGKIWVLVLNQQPCLEAGKVGE